MGAANGWILDAYIRVSRVGGRSGDSYQSPTLQEAEIRRWAQQRGVTIARVVTEEDVSGRVPIERRGLGELVRRAQRGETAGIVVLDVSRFARNMLEGKTAIERLRAAGARLADTRGNDSIDNPMAVDMYLVIGEDQLRNLTAQWERSSGRAVARGVHVACRAPLGYLRRDQIEDTRERDGRLVRDPDKADLVREGFESRAREDGRTSLQQVAKMLGTSKSNARQLLRNRVYLGEARGPNGATLRGAHEPLVSEELFAAVQLTFKTDNRPEKRARRAQPAGVLSGFIRCAGCGHLLRDLGAHTTYPSYSCMGKYAGGDCSAPAAAAVKRVDDFVIALIEEARMDGRIVEAFTSRQRAWDAARAKVDAAESRLERTIDAVLKLEDRARARRRVREAEEALSEAQASFYAIDAPGTETEEADAAWRAALAEVTLSKADPRRRRHQPIAERVQVRWAAY